MTENNVLSSIKILSDNDKVQKILISTIGSIAFRQNNYDNFFIENKEKIDNICKWITSIVQNNKEWKSPRVITLEALNNDANKFFDKNVEEDIEHIELDETYEKLVLNLGDYYISNIVNLYDVERIFLEMHNFIKNSFMFQKKINLDYKYFLLKDKMGNSHVLIETEKNRIIELYGVKNEFPKLEHINLLLPWLNDFDLSLFLKYMNKYEYILNKNDNKFYSKYDMPNNCIVEYLEFSNCSVKLPENLIVNRNLSLISCNIKNIPETLIVYGKLDLSGCITLEKLPDNLIVNGDICLSECRSLEKLPDSLIINKSLDLSETKIKELPKNIQIIYGNLCISKSMIEKLPDNLIVNGNLEASGCLSLKELPQNLIIKESLYLSKSGIKNINKDVKIGKNLYLDYSEIEKLPDNLIINGDLHLNFCQNLKELPDNLVVKRYLSISDSTIEKIPNNINCYSIFCDKKHAKLIEEKMCIKRLFLYHKGIFTKKYQEYEMSDLFPNKSNIAEMKLLFYFSVFIFVFAFIVPLFR